VVSGPQEKSYDQVVAEDAQAVVDAAYGDLPSPAAVHRSSPPHVDSLTVQRLRKAGLGFVVDGTTRHLEWVHEAYQSSGENLAVGMQIMSGVETGSAGTMSRQEAALAVEVIRNAVESSAPDQDPSGAEAPEG